MNAQALVSAEDHGANRLRTPAAPAKLEKRKSYFADPPPRPPFFSGNNLNFEK
jgi:hypothetical protein